MFSPLLLLLLLLLLTATGGTAVEAEAEVDVAFARSVAELLASASGVVEDSWGEVDEEIGEDVVEDKDEDEEAWAERGRCCKSARRERRSS